MHFQTELGGGRFAGSMDTGVTGHGADFIILDDPLSAQNAFSDTERENVNRSFDGMVASRLNDRRTGVIIIVAQRLHEKDLIGHVASKGGWKHLCLPFMAEERTTYRIGVEPWIREVGDLLLPRRYTPEVIETLKRDLGPAAFATQYQQYPVPPQGAYVCEADFPLYQREPPGLRMMLSCDLAQKENGTSYSAFLVVATDGRRFFVTDVVRAHLAYTDMRLVAEKLISDWHPNEILIEDAASGSALISDLRATGHVVQGVKPGTSNKVARLLRHLDVLKGQAVLVPEYAPWRAALVSELVGFPYAEHDDQVDALTQLIQFSKDNPQGPAHHIAVRDPFGAPVPVNAFGRRLQKGEHAMRPRRIGHRCPTARG